MTAIQPVFPRPTSLVIYNHVLAENQPEYTPLPVTVVEDGRIPILCRFRLSPEELQLILDGGDIVVQQLTFGRGYNPLAISVVAQDENPQVTQ